MGQSRQSAGRYQEGRPAPVDDGFSPGSTMSSDRTSVIAKLVRVTRAKLRTSGRVTTSRRWRARPTNKSPTSAAADVPAIE